MDFVTGGRLRKGISEEFVVHVLVRGLNVIQLC